MQYVYLTLNVVFNAVYLFNRINVVLFNAVCLFSRINVVLRNAFISANMFPLILSFSLLDSFLCCCFSNNSNMAFIEPVLMLSLLIGFYIHLTQLYYILMKKITLLSKILHFF